MNAELADPRPGRSPARLPIGDVVAAVGLAAFLVTVAPVAPVPEAHARPVSPAAIALLAACGLALVARGLHPAGSAAVMIGTAAAYLGLGYAGWPVYLGAFAGLVVLVTGVAEVRRWAPLAAVGGLGVLLGTGRLAEWRPVPALTVAAVWCAVAVFGEREARRRRRWLDEETARRQVEERLRIARELHDVLSHSLASISLQAGVGLHLADRQPEQARQALGSIRQLSAEALGQARAALSTVRAGEAVERPPAAPGLADLPGLVASAAASGLRVEWRGEVGDVEVSDAVASTAYRVLQEGLTNAMRHAGPGAQVCAQARADGAWLQLEVTDDGAGQAAAGGGAGHGLRGMAERVEEVGGRLRVGPRPGGGFAVEARLPRGRR